MSIPKTQKTFRRFDPKNYLKEYYTSLGRENKFLLEFHEKSYSRIFSLVKQARMLELGSGPNVYHMIAACKYELTIDIADYLDTNLDEIRRWLRDDPDKFNWEDYFKYCLELEGEVSTPSNIRARENELRKKVNKLTHCDVMKKHPIGKEYDSFYDIVSTHFVGESITGSRTEWESILKNTISLIKPRGFLILGSIIGATYYKVGKKYYPAVPVTAEEIKSSLNAKQLEVLEEGFVGAERREEQGYEGLHMLLARQS